MPTIFSHAVVGGAAANLAGPGQRRLVVTAGVLAMLPDLDVLGFRFGVPYASHWGHRGFTHSLVFAAASSLVAAVWLRTPRRYPWLFLAAASHPLLDMLTTGGMGCALFAPFSWNRLFFPFRPIPVSPIGLRSRVVRVLAWEVWLLWPLGAASWALHRPWRRSAKLAVIVGSLAALGAGILVRVW